LALVYNRLTEGHQTADPKAASSLLDGKPNRRPRSKPLTDPDPEARKPVFGGAEQLCHHCTLVIQDLSISRNGNIFANGAGNSLGQISWPVRRSSKSERRQA
jgi:hypothetical protein